MPVLGLFPPSLALTLLLFHSFTPVLALVLSVSSLIYRKKGLLLNNLLGVGGACLMAFSQMSNSFEMLILGRLVIGINCGELWMDGFYG